MELVFDVWTIISRELIAMSLVSSRDYYSLQLVSKETRHGILSCLSQLQAKKQFVRKVTETNDVNNTKKEYWVLPNGKRNGMGITIVNEQVAWHSFYLADYCLFKTRVDLIKFKKPEEFMRSTCDDRKTISADYSLASGVLVRKTVIVGSTCTFYMSSKQGNYFSLYFKLGRGGCDGVVMESPTSSGYELVIQTDYYKIIFDLAKSAFYSLCNDDFKQQIMVSIRKLRSRNSVEEFAKSLATAHGWKCRHHSIITYMF